MILTSIILGAIVTAGVVGVVSIFWNDLIDFLQRSVKKVMQLVEGILYGSKVFIKKVAEGVREISRHYSKVEGHWQETTTTKIVSEDQVPADILKRASYNTELDITDELEMKLESA